MTDIDTMIAGLEEQKAKCDAAIVALRALSPGYASGEGQAAVDAPEQRPVGAGKKMKPPKAVKAARKGSKDWDLGRQLWIGGVPTVEIGKRLGLSGAGVLYQARTKKWPKRETVFGSRKDKTENPEPAAPPAPVASAVAVKEPVKPKPIAVPRVATETKTEKQPVPRRCDHCGLITEKDPCGKCGEPMVTWKSAMSA